MGHESFLDFSFLTCKMIFGHSIYWESEKFHPLCDYMEHDIGGNIILFSILFLIMWLWYRIFWLSHGHYYQELLFVPGHQTGSPQRWTLCLPLYNSTLKKREIQEVVKSDSHLDTRETRYAFVKWLENNPRKNLINIGVLKNHVLCNLAVKFGEWNISKLRNFADVRILGGFR